MTKKAPGPDNMTYKIIINGEEPLQNQNGGDRQTEEWELGELISFYTSKE